MVTFSSRLFDISHSPVVLREDPANSQLTETERRLSRTATLDGAVRIDDAGYSDGDRTLRVFVENVAAADLMALKALQRADGMQYLALSDGVYEGGIELISVVDGDMTVTFLVHRRISD